jgi:2-polyprenyl-3-methyl-5-hydroxy-6-metoxy-1,4-benzoquinol methylase
MVTAPLHTKFGPCILCMSANVDFFFRRFDSHLFSTKTKFTVCKCKNCGLVFVSPTPSWEELSKYYSRWDEISSSRPVSRLRKLIKRPHTVVKGLRLLDVGCGDGTFLQEMRVRGYDVHGVEPDRLRAKICRDNSFDVVCGTVMDLHFKNYFDVITFNHVFEHIPNPHETLDRCQELLRDNGMLIFQLPRSDSLLAMVFSRNCQLFALPGHLFNYSTQNFSILLKSHGFEIMRKTQIPAPGSFVESLSLAIYGKEGEIRARWNYVIKTVGILFELLAMVFDKTGNVEVYARHQKVVTAA